MLISRIFLYKLILSGSCQKFDTVDTKITTSTLNPIPWQNIKDWLIVFYSSFFIHPIALLHIGTLYFVVFSTINLVPHSTDCRSKVIINSRGSGCDFQQPRAPDHYFIGHWDGPAGTHNGRFQFSQLRPLKKKCAMIFPFEFKTGLLCALSRKRTYTWENSVKCFNAGCESCLYVLIGFDFMFCFICMYS